MLVPSVIRNERRRNRSREEQTTSIHVITSSSTEYYELLSSKTYKPAYSGRVVSIKVDIIGVKIG